MGAGILWDFNGWIGNGVMGITVQDYFTGIRVTGVFQRGFRH